MYLLNNTAACIWRHIERHADPALAAKEIADSLAIGEATALVYMRDMVEQWSDLNLLDDGRPRREERPIRRQAAAAVVEDGFFASPATACRRHYALLGTVVSVGFTEERLEALVHPTLRHLEVASSRLPELAIDVVTSPTGHEIRCNGHRIGSCDRRTGIAPLVNGHIFQLAISRYPHVVALHSGAVASSRGCLLLPAASGSGKSTLTAALCQAGWRYMADDIVLLRHGDLNAVGVPNALGIKAGAWETLQSCYPELATLTMHDRSDGKRIRYLAPPSQSHSEAADGVAIRWIVFPRYESGGPVEMCPLHTAEGLYRLMAHCCGLPERLTHEQVAGMVQWIEDVSCFELAFSDLSAAVRAINAHSVEPRRADQTSFR
jgi:hypothetical protein